MPALPKITGELNVKNLKIPKISPHHASYQIFLGNVAGLNSQQLLAQLHKRDIDERYAEMLKQTFPKDPIAIRQLLDEANSASGLKSWAELTESSWSTRHSTRPLSAEVLHLRLPAIAHHFSRGNGKDQHDNQDYQTFADKAQKMNPETKFTKETMDDAFRLTTSRLPRGSGIRRNGLEQMVNRCLGRESTVHWKGR